MGKGSKKSKTTASKSAEAAAAKSEKKRATKAAAKALVTPAPPAITQNIVELSDALDELTGRAEEELHDFSSALDAALTSAIAAIDRVLRKTEDCYEQVSARLAGADVFVAERIDSIRAASTPVEAIAAEAEAVVIARRAEIDSATHAFRNELASTQATLEVERNSFDLFRADVVASIESRALEVTAKLDAMCVAAGELSRQESREAAERVAREFTEELAVARAQIHAQQAELQSAVDALRLELQVHAEYAAESAAESAAVDPIERLSWVPDDLLDVVVPTSPSPAGGTEQWADPVDHGVRETDVFEASPESQAADDFFGQLAAELAADPDPHAFPSRDGWEPGADDVMVEFGETSFSGDGLPVPAFPQTGAPTWDPAAAASAGATRTRVADPLRPQTRPVSVTVAAEALAVSLATLARSAADGAVRMDVVHTAATGVAKTLLRLTVWDLSGWWEYHELDATATNLEPASVVVGISDARDALTTWDQFGDRNEVLINLEGDVTIGNTLLITKPGLEPELSWNRTLVERVELKHTGRAGVEIETQLGRLAVPSRLVSLLRSRRAESVELMVIDDGPSLSARVLAPSADTTVTIIAPLAAPGADQSALQAERRDLRTRDVKHLVRALSFDATAEELDEILEHGVAYTRRLAAAHPNLARERIEHLLREGTEAIRGATAGNPSLDVVLCEIAAKDSSTVVRSAVAANPNLSPQSLADLIADADRQVRARAASNESVTPAQLEELARDPDADVRAAVAAERGISVELLQLLARDPDPVVCAAVAGNEQCPAATLRELVSVVPHAVMASPRTSASLLEAGSRINDPTLRAVVAANPATPTKRLDALSHDEAIEVLRNVAENPNTSSSIRRRVRRKLTPE